MIGNDWLSRQIEGIGRVVTAMLLGKSAVNEIVSEDEENGESYETSEEMLLSYMLNNYISGGNINEAENLLFDSIEGNINEKKYKIAMDFYAELEKMADTTLHKYDFTRQEIFNGISDVKRLYKHEHIDV
ncbi:MAG: DUF6483 family protein [Defluviitaleaceae bacterium]|nr:DUF6483 family protein [Defluviitaleaceae bacterium]MCL2264142.1 DUF6483 family protein [Defluviitaleaceae bacterium]